MDLYNVAQQVTDEVLGAGSYAEANKGNPDPDVQRAIREAPDRDLCYDCGVQPGSPHRDGCDVARCTNCGFQRISCECDENVGWGQIWAGRWPGELEVEEGLATDLNDLTIKALHGELEWNGTRWVTK